MMTEEHQVQANLNYNVVEILRGEELGVGSYGAVYRAKCDELLCAAKVLHPILFAEGDTDGEAHLVRQFDRECHFLKDLRHPNVVQYLGMYTEGNERVLLMELMDGNLTRYLEHNEHAPLPYHVAMDMSNDVALALAYLHSNYIVHRDLSSNNVLLLGERRAKVSDFGVSKLISPHRQRQSSLTLCPGNSAYMPPEAIDETHATPYSEKLDCFSFGVLCVQILTRKFPAPTARLVAAGNAYMRVVVAEVERRREHIDMIDVDHLFREIILQCLCDSEEDRPSAQEICHRLVRLKDGPRYAESTQEGDTRPTAPRRDDGEIHRRDQEIQDLQQQLRQSQDERDQLRQQVRRSRAEVTRKNREIEEKSRTIAELERGRLQQTRQIDELAANVQEAQQQLRRSEQQFQTDIMGLEQTISEQDITINNLTTVISELQEELKRREKLINQQRARSEATSHLRLTSRYGGEALYPMRREPDATVFWDVVYFKYFWGKHIISYDIESKRWSELPPCPNSSFSMAVIDRCLTIIGGKTPNLDPTNSLVSFINSQWTEEFPPMPTKRYWTIAVTYSGSIIVLGGETEGRTVVCTVEVFNSESRQWSVACSLPQPFDSATATVCTEQLFLACGSSENTARCVLSCSISHLLESCRPASESGHPLREPGMWSRISDLPFRKMTITNLNDYLLAAGGKEKSGSPSSAVYVYDEVTTMWIEIGHLKLARSSCFAVSLSRNEVMVVGGLVDSGGKEATNSVELLAMD